MIKKTFAGVIAFCFAFLACFASACNTGLKFYQYKDVVFSLSMAFEAELAGKNAKKAYDEMLAVLQEINLQTNINSTLTFKKENDNTLSAESFESDILRFNRLSAGQEVKLNKHSYNLIKLAKEIYADPLVKKSFNAAIYPLTYLWGVDSLNVGLDGFAKTPPPSFNSGYTIPIAATMHPSNQQVLDVKELCDLNNLVITEKDDGNYASKLKEGLMLDMGGLAKGYALNLCKEICIKYQIDAAFIELSGQVLTYKKDGIDYDWAMIVREPKKTEIRVDYICGFDIKENTSISTSGHYERYRSLFSDPNKQGVGEELIDVCHIIDPNTGIPYDAYIDANGHYKNFDDHILSCTVILEDAALADAYSTIACVMGLKKAVEFFESKNIKAVMFTKDKRMALTGGLTLIENHEDLSGYKEYRQI